MRKVYLLIDIENVSVKNLQNSLEDLFQRMHSDGYEVFKVGYASTRANLIEEWNQLIRFSFDIPQDHILSICSLSGYDSADMALCFIAGMWCKENELDKYPFLLLSNDKLLKRIENQIQSMSIECLRYELDPEKYKGKKKEPHYVEFNGNNYPFCLYPPQKVIPSLSIIECPSKTDHPIQSIPIPNIGEELSLGRGSNNDICLDYWDQYNPSLYSTHLFLGYSHDSIYIRSAKGHRRGRRSIEINGILIDSSQGNVPINNGDLLKVGLFVFKVSLPRLFSERPLLNNNDIHSVLDNIEILLSRWIRGTLQALNKDWWTLYIDQEIRDQCEERNTSSIEHSFNYLLFSDLGKIIMSNWVVFSPLILPLFLTRRLFRKAFSRLTEIRNLKAHPMRKDLDIDDIAFANSFYNTMLIIIPNNPALA